MEYLKSKIKKKVIEELMESKAKDLLKLSGMTALGAAYGLTAGLGATASPVGGAIGAIGGAIAANKATRIVQKNKRNKRAEELQVMIRDAKQKIADWRSDGDDEEKISNKRVQIMKWQKELDGYDKS